MQLLDGPQLASRLCECTPSSTEVRLAVAFWGDGATAHMKVREGQSVRVICNLKTGGTNPLEIRALKAKGAKVLQSDILHAKIYLLDDFGVVGSSNASANGLSLQGPECRGWDEANVMFERGSFYDQVESRFDCIWKSAREITEDDLVHAYEVWSRRRHLTLGNAAGRTLLDVLRTQEGLIADRRVYVAVARSYLSDDQREVISAEQERSGEGMRVDGFGWPELPNDAYLVSFFLGPRGGLTHDGLWQMPMPRRPKPTGNPDDVQFCYKLDDIAGVTEIGPIAEWKQVLLSTSEYRKGGSFFIEVGELARTYLAGRG